MGVCSKGAHLSLRRESIQTPGERWKYEVRGLTSTHPGTATDLPAMEMDSLSRASAASTREHLRCAPYDAEVKHRKGIWRTNLLR